MAYREFHNEPYYKQPEIDLFPKTLALLQTVAATRMRQQQHNWDLAANYKQDKLESKFTNDQKFLNDVSQRVKIGRAHV